MTKKDSAWRGHSSCYPSELDGEDGPFENWRGPLAIRQLVCSPIGLGVGAGVDRDSRLRGDPPGVRQHCIEVVPESHDPPRAPTTQAVPPKQYEPPEGGSCIH